jgi:uncharacterized protein YndB with AHSA1/START domain
MADDVIVERSVELDAAPDEVWDALTDPGRLSAWVGGAVVELDVRPGGRGTVLRSDGATRRVAVELVDAPNRLVLRWWPFESRSGSVRPAAGGEGTHAQVVSERTGPEAGSGGMRTPVGSGTRVEFLLERVRRARTLLRVREFPPLGGVESKTDEGSTLDDRWTTGVGWSVDAIGVEAPFRTRRSNLRAAAR